MWLSLYSVSSALVNNVARLVKAYEYIFDCLQWK